MNSFGASLKRERESRGISLQEISDRTKIGVRLLKALEEEQFDQLPGGIFDKSFLRQYARYLGLDEDRLVSEYQQAIGATQEPSPPPPSFVPDKQSASPSGGYLRLILTAVCVGIGIAAIFYTVRQFTQRHAPASAADKSPPLSIPKEPSQPVMNPLSPGTLPDTTGKAMATETPVPALPSASVGGGPSQPSPPAPAHGTATQQTAVALPGKPTGIASATSAAAPALVLQIDTQKECWISITADGQKQWQGMLPAGRLRRVEARDSVQLTVGDAGAVSLILNGKALPALGRSGEVKTVTISPKGLAQPAAP